MYRILHVSLSQIIRCFLSYSEVAEIVDNVKSRCDAYNADICHAAVQTFKSCCSENLKSNSASNYLNTASNTCHLRQNLNTRR